MLRDNNSCDASHIASSLDPCSIWFSNAHLGPPVPYFLTGTGGGLGGPGGTACGIPDGAVEAIWEIGTGGWKRGCIFCRALDGSRSECAESGLSFL